MQTMKPDKITSNYSKSTDQEIIGIHVEELIAKELLSVNAPSLLQEGCP